MSALSGRVGHVLVVFDGTDSSRRARGCSMSAVHSNPVMDEMAGRQLAEARAARSSLLGCDMGAASGPRGAASPAGPARAV